jgi:putative drug exporter of the RND superfamily
LLTAATWGRLVYQFRRSVLIVSLAPLVAAFWLSGQGGHFRAPAMPTTTESGTALTLMEGELPLRPASFTLIFGHPTLKATDQAFAAEVRRALEALRADPRVTRVFTGYDGSPRAPGYFSRDGHHTRVIVELAGQSSGWTSIEFASPGSEVYPDLRALVRSDQLTVVAAGALALNHDFNQAAQRDLRRVELLVLPLVLVLLVLVFGSLVAAGLPLAIGALAVTAGWVGTALLARITPVSVYATNVLTMIGLGVAIDYSLFIVSRFREEVRAGGVAEALARTTATAGHAVLFAGATVAVGLLGLTLLKVEGLGSMGLAGMIVVGFAVFYSLTFLPAVLAILGPRVDAGRLWAPRAELSAGRRGLWHRWARQVMAHPWGVLVPVVGFLVVVGSPVLHLRLGSSDATALPAGAESRRGEALLREQFPDGNANRILLVVNYPDGSPLRPDRVDRLYELSRWLAQRPDVARVESVVDVVPALSAAQYERLLAAPPAALPSGVQAFRAQTVGPHIVVMTVSTAAPPDSSAARTLVRTIRRSHPPLGGALLVTGRTAFDLDFLDLVTRAVPLVIGSVVVATYVVLFALLWSVVLPLKAVVMNVLSISASYGALVWIFQDGHFARWLNVTARPIEIAIPIVMFCVMFGVSMDYEVLLLSRIREEYAQTSDNEHAVGRGLEQTGRLITGAAAIMAGVFFGFGLAETVIIKAVGIGMGIAVVIDATIVRVLLVPATMRLLGQWNWWAPAPLARLHHRIGAR